MAKSIKDMIDALVPNTTRWHTYLLENWASIMGPLHDKVRLEKVQDDTLVLGVFDACWMQELYLLTPMLLKTINDRLDKPYVKALRFRAAAQEHRVKKEQPLRRKLVIKSRTLTVKEQKALAKIDDEQLRSALQQFLFHCSTERL